MSEEPQPSQETTPAEPEAPKEVHLSVTEIMGKVILKFDQPIDSLPLSPRQARELASMLRKYSDIAYMNNIRKN